MAGGGEVREEPASGSSSRQHGLKGGGGGGADGLTGWLSVCQVGEGAVASSSPAASPVVPSSSSPIDNPPLGPTLVLSQYRMVRERDAFLPPFLLNLIDRTEQARAALASFLFTPSPQALMPTPQGTHTPQPPDRLPAAAGLMD